MGQSGDGKLVEFFPSNMSLADAFGCLFENASDAIYILDTHGNFVAVNHKAEELTGFRREDFVGKPFRKIIPFKSWSKAIKGFLSVIRGKTIRLELELKTADERKVLVEVTSTPFTSNGKIVGALGIVRDVTERALMEKRLSEANRKLEMLLTTAMEGITVVDPQENVTFANKAFATMMGYTEEELIGINLRKFVTEDDFKKIQEQAKDREHGKAGRYEIVLQRKDGEPRTFQVSAAPLWNEDGDFAGTMAICMDVTERKRIEGTLRASEEKFRQIFESANDGLVYGDLTGKILDLNKSAEGIAGIKREEIIGQPFWKLGIVSPKNVITLFRRLSFKTKNKESRTLELTITLKNGEKKLIEINSAIVQKNKMPAGFLAIVRDITERTKMENALRDSEERFRAITTSAKDAIVMADNEGKISYWNPAAEKIFGYTKEEAIGKEMYVLLAPHRFREGFMRGFGQFTESGKGDLVGKTVELLFVKKDGTEFPVEISISTLRIKGKWHAVGILRDVTERRHMQKKLEEYSQHLEELVEKRTRQLKEAHEQILKAERLAAIGQVAAMVGHDLRNPLTGIAGATYYLKTRFGLKIDKKAGEMLEIIEKDIEHSNKIINDLLDYSREVQLELTETTPKSILKEALSLVEVPKNIQIIDLTRDETRIKVDINKIKRVFVNLIKNSIDAMPKGGRLAIKSTKSDVSVQISFSDTGTGMPKETLEKIWTPLFTTKAKGMGLGLPICKRIIDAHKGTISVESTVGKGTTFTLAIPVEPRPEKEGGEKVWVKEPESLLSTTTRA